MARILLIELLVLLSPFLAYMIWRALKPAEPAPDGAEAGYEKAEPPQPEMPVLTLAMIGGVMALIVFIGMILIAGPREVSENEPFSPPPLRDRSADEGDREPS